jgi:hypothetical protein
MWAYFCPICSTIRMRQIPWQSQCPSDPADRVCGGDRPVPPAPPGGPVLGVARSNPLVRSPPTAADHRSRAQHSLLRPLGTSSTAITCASQSAVPWTCGWPAMRWSSSARSATAGLRWPYLAERRSFHSCTLLHTRFLDLGDPGTHHLLPLGGAGVLGFLLVVSGVLGAQPGDVLLVGRGRPVAEFGRHLSQPSHIQFSHACAQPLTNRLSAGAGHLSELAYAARRSSALAPPRSPRCTWPAHACSPWAPCIPAATLAVVALDIDGRVRAAVWSCAGTDQGELFEAGGITSKGSGRVLIRSACRE